MVDIDADIENTERCVDAAETLISAMMAAEHNKVGRAKTMMLLIDVELADGAIETWRITIERATLTQ